MFLSNFRIKNICKSTIKQDLNIFFSFLFFSFLVKNLSLYQIIIIIITIIIIIIITIIIIIIIVNEKKNKR